MLVSSSFINRVFFFFFFLGGGGGGGGGGVGFTLTTLRNIVLRI